MVSKISKYSHFRLRFSLYYLEKNRKKYIITLLYNLLFRYVSKGRQGG